MTKTTVIAILLTILLTAACAKPAPPAPVTQPVTIPPPVESPSPTPPQPASPVPTAPQPVTSAPQPPVQAIPEPSGPSSSSGPQLGAVKSPPDRQLVQYALELINKDRTDNGLTQVTVGSNAASQVHAEEMLANNYISHWELSGLKPYMRYTLAGGYNYESENLFLLVIASVGGHQHDDARSMLGKAEEALMSSPGHRATILGLQHKKVSLGIAYSGERLALVQQFEGDYVNFSKPPSINGGVLMLSGELSGGLEIGQIQIWYDRLPAPLTIGQLGATATYWRGKPATFIRPPPPPGAFYPEYETKFSWETSIDPYAIPASTPPPDTSGPARASPPPVTVSDTVRWVDAKTWNVSGSSFAIEANLSTILERFSAGVYTVVIWTKGGAESFTVSNYSLFIR